MRAMKDARGMFKVEWLYETLLPFGPWVQLWGGSVTCTPYTHWRSPDRGTHWDRQTRQHGISLLRDINFFWWSAWVRRSELWMDSDCFDIGGIRQIPCFRTESCRPQSNKMEVSGEKESLRKKKCCQNKQDIIKLTRQMTKASTSVCLDFPHFLFSL